MLLIVLPLPVVVFTVMPSKLSFTVAHSIFELTFVDSLFSHFRSVLLLVIHELTLKLEFFSDVDSFTVPKLLALRTSNTLSDINSVAKPNDTEVWFL
jgi:hypothetical protein